MNDEALNFNADALSLVPTEEIFDELKRRFDRGAFVWNQKVDSEDEEWGGKYWGGKASALGLAMYLKEFILSDLMECYCEEEEN